MTINKKELIKEFDRWLGDEFDNSNKKIEGETHRWVFCEDFKEGSMFSDCACCSTHGKIEGCECVCHQRVEQIVDFFINKLKEKK